MKRLFSRRLPVVLVGMGSALVLAISAVSFASASTGVSNQPTTPWTCQSNGLNHVAFDSFTGVPTNQNPNNPCDTSGGTFNEPNFFTGVQVGRDSTWQNPVPNVAQNSEVEAKIYIHNNADPNLNASGAGVAHNVTVRVDMSNATSTMAKTQDLVAYISASNATPQTIYDTLQINGANEGYFKLAEETGTAQLHEHNGQVINLTPAQEQALFSPAGVNLGDQKGCFDYVQEITFKMKVQMPQYAILKEVRLPGQTAADWKKSLTVANGQTVEWTVKFSNIGSTQLDNVDMVDQIPTGLTVVPGSVIMYNSSYPNGIKDTNNTSIQENGRQLNINMGSFAALSDSQKKAGDLSGQIIYDTKVNATNLNCGVNSFVNKAYTTPSGGLGAIEDTASVNVNKTCKPTTPTTPTKPTTPPKQLVNTGPGNVIGLFGLTTVVGAVAHRLFWRRLFVRG